MAASATATLSLCSSFATHCKISQNLQTPSTYFSFPSLSLSSSHKLSSCSSRRPTFPLLTKSSESDSAVVVEAEFQAPEPEAGPDDSEPAALQVVETPSSEAPKREQLFAVVMIGGRQYIVIPGRFIYTQRLKGANVNDKIVLNKVLLVGTKTSTYIGKPVVTNAAVHAVVEEQGLNDKVVVFKYKKKKNYRRNIGHRQPNTRIRITAVTGYQDYPAVTLES
ncbi:50S ribosomal protein L21, chloroplastic [Pyrus x bretschneideri]|uniref:50S ribosomal protein L21, chloroplastic n=1 Tax=Pyrus x bretschneideri TaxID=225117 RepID=UPI00202DC334|nr:50S ribosomal protein L21, chloroplastic [Pyrus x bretschneideri]